MASSGSDLYQLSARRGLAPTGPPECRRRPLRIRPWSLSSAQQRGLTRSPGDTPPERPDRAPEHFLGSSLWALAAPLRRPRSREAGPDLKSGTAWFPACAAGRGAPGTRSQRIYIFTHTYTSNVFSSSSISVSEKVYT